MAQHNENISNPASEELFDRAYQDLSPADQAIVDRIAGRVNKKVSQRTGYVPSPTKPNWYLYGGLGAGIVAVVLTVALWNSENSDEIVAEINSEEVSPQENNEAQIAPTETDVVTDNPVTEDVADVQEEAIKNYSSADQELPNEVADLINQINQQNTEQNTEETPLDIEAENDGGAIEYHTDPQVVEMKVVDVEIFSERPILDDKDKSSNNNDVNDPNIGNATNNNNKSVTYDPDDLPSYYGGQAALKAEVLKLTGHIKLEDNSGDLKTTVVYFKVNHKGDIEDLRIMAPINDEIDQAVTDAFDKLPLWSKGKKKWKLEYVISITFN